VSPDPINRYAIYAAPDPQTDLWHRASTWLGRDAATGEAVEQPAIAGIARADFAALTADPRHYGFHGTLKAPFRLAKAKSEAELVAGLDQFAATQAAFDATLEPASLGRFVAFRPVGEVPEIQAFHEASLREFEPFRTPLLPADLERRRKAGLSEEQDRLLLDWGYPYVLQHFRFHMTLTGSVADGSLRARLLDAAKIWFAEHAGPWRFNSVALFRQVGGGDFTLLAHARFAQ
jgi:hypothetical protein